MTFIPFSPYPSYFIPSTSLPHAFEIAAIHSYPHPPPPTMPRLTPFNTFHRHQVPLEPTPSPLPTHPLSFSLPLSTLSPSSPSIAIAMPTHLVPFSLVFSLTISPLLCPLPLILILQYPAVVTNLSHELFECICPFMDMDYLSCFSCVIFSFLFCFHWHLPFASSSYLHMPHSLPSLHSRLDYLYGTLCYSIQPPLSLILHLHTLAFSSSTVIAIWAAHILLLFRLIDLAYVS